MGGGGAKNKSFRTIVLEDLGSLRCSSKYLYGWPDAKGSEQFT